MDDETLLHDTLVRGLRMSTAARHQEISDVFLEHAEDEFEKGDLLQASEKTWGAVAHYVKSVARNRMAGRTGRIQTYVRMPIG